MIDRRAIFIAAHAAAKQSARWDRTSGAYRFHFSRHLKAAYAEAQRIELGRKMIAAAEAREALRQAQNTGLPIRTCHADRRRSFMGGNRFSRAVGE